MAGELAPLLATELHITKLKAGEALCVVGEAADSMLRGKDFLLGLALESSGSGLGRVLFFILSSRHSNLN
jgi:hypothetical protein